MARILSAAVAAALFSFAGLALAQNTPPAPPAPPDFSKVEIKTTDLGHNTYLLQGQGGNITVAVGGDGVVMVDGEFAPLHDKIKAAIAAVTQQPVKYLINTHYHGDHSGGNAPFAADGAKVVAQENVKKRLEEGTTNALTGNKTPPAAPEALPAQTYGDKLVLKVKGRSATLAHIQAAHTDGDTYVYFKDANVLSTGDIVTVGGRYPNIDVGAGGNIKGMIAGADTFLKVANDQTKIVPGHGPLLTKADVRNYRALLVDARDRVAKLVKQGKTIDEAVAAKPLADLDAKAGANQQGSDNFVKLIYLSLKPAKA
jgi:glyoxylase-like metal-dependent hydrolase (beta-lactamase superfamily II)